jgi:hypothetical protein
MHMHKEQSQAGVSERKPLQSGTGPALQYITLVTKSYSNEKFWIKSWSIHIFKNIVLQATAISLNTQNYLVEAGLCVIKDP